MRSIETAVLALVAFTLMGVLPGCGSNRTGAESSGAVAGPFGVDAANVPYVGADQCITCHSGLAWSVDEVADYLVGKHVIHGAGIDAAMGATGCLACHDPIGDGRNLEGLIAAADVPAAGLAAVTCEACHGAGGQHFGVGPIPIATPDYNVCGNCHNTNFATTTAAHSDFTEASHIFEDYQASLHYAASGVRNEPLCVKCHTDEGGRQYRDVITKADLDATLPIAGVASPIQCRTCHNAHNPGELLKTAGSASAEYNTCINCHQRHDARLAADPGTADGASGDLIYHATHWDRVISSTHYDNPTTVGLIEGYSMNPANEHVCRDCHNVHSASITINRQWAGSGHGGDLLGAKEAAAATQTAQTFAEVQAVLGAGTASSWAAEAWPAAAQAACQRCHTATGGKNFIIDSAAYAAAMQNYVDDPALHTNPNDFSYLAAGAQEMLFCWACHADNSGALRIQAEVNLLDHDNAIFATIPAKGKSTVCVGCHGGRANGGYYATQAPADRSSESLVHKLPAAATLFSEQTHVGYEFAGQNYADKEFFAHKNIGLNHDSPETGAGPCAGCHMANADHGLKAVTVDEGGTITAINNQTLCATCHGPTMTPDALKAEKAGFEAAKVLLLACLQTNYLDLDLTTSAGVQAAPLEAYGIAQNYLYLTEDAGAYVHNRYYVKRLIFDAIDWLQDGDLDGVLNLDGQDAAYNYLVTWATGAPKPPITAMTRP